MKDKHSNIIFSINASNICQTNSYTSNNVIDFEDYLSFFEQDPQKNIDNDYMSLFMYDTCPVAFLGRDSEMSMLKEFVLDNRRILWWAITGAAGSGKTRLAYEFINQLKKDKKWLSCFVNFPQFLDDLLTLKFRLTFGKNIFMVIDYVYAYEANIAQIIELIDRVKSCKKVRILLIEREYVRTSKEGKTIAPWEGFFANGFFLNP